MSIQVHLSKIEEEIAMALDHIADMPYGDDKAVAALTLRVSIAGYLGVLVADLPQHALRGVIDFMVERKGEVEASRLTSELISRLMAPPQGSVQ